MDNLRLLVFLCVLGGAAAEYCTSYHRNGQYISGFNCPRLLFDDYDEYYCCGSSYSGKYCCSYNSLDGGFWTARVVIGICVAMGGIIFVICLIACCLCASCPLYKHRNRGRVIAPPGNGMTVVHTSTQPVMTQYPQPMGYPVQPQGAPGYGVPPQYTAAYPPPQYPATGSAYPDAYPAPAPAPHQLYK